MRRFIAGGYNVVLKPGGTAACVHTLDHKTAIPATCTASGTGEYYACTKCSKMFEDIGATKPIAKVPVVEALKHNLVQHNAKSETCTEIGWNAYETCSRCDYSTCVPIPAKGHTIVSHAAKAATCTENGNEAYWSCSVCNKLFKDSETTIIISEIPVIKALGHNTVQHNAKSETCTEIGWAAYETCSRCDYSTYVPIPAKGHTIVSHAAKAATCTENGNEAYWSCSVCNKLFKDSETTIIILEIPVIKAYDHTIFIDAAVSPTCTENGLTEGSRCSVCYLIIVAQKVVSALGHNYAAPEWTWNGYEATAFFTCSLNSSHTLNKVANVTNKITLEPTPTTEGTRTYTATVTQDGKIYTSTKTETLAPNPVYHSVNYQNTKGIEIPENYLRFAEHENFFLPDETIMKVEHYEFKGWYTASTGGALVDYIESGTASKDQVLFARWEAKEYTITYINAADNDNALKYTIESGDYIELKDPKWDGLVFAGWTDENGDPCEKIVIGSGGNRTVTANWKYKENISISSSSNESMVFYEDGKYYFMHKLGVIDSIVLDILASSTKSDNGEIEWTKNETFQIDQSIGENIAESIGKNISNTTQLSEAIEWAQKESSSVNWQNSASLSTSASDAISGSISASIGGSAEFETSRKDAVATSLSASSGTESSSSYNSMLSYAISKSFSISETQTVSANMPAGIYTYACVGTVDVYVMVTYDPITEDYFVTTYGIMRDNSYRTSILYKLETETEQKVTIKENAPLSYTVPVEEIKEYVNSSLYTVEFDSNGGDGEMPILVFDNNQNHKIPANQFSKTGYIFSYWEVIENNSVVTTIINEGKLNGNLFINNTTIILKAKWIPKEYTVTLDVQGGNSLDSDKNKITVKYGEPYGSLPTPEKPKYVFLGWYTEKNGSGAKIESDTRAYIIEDTTLYANWEHDKVNVTFVWADGQKTVPTNIDSAAVAPIINDPLFVCWDKAFSKVTDDMIVNALYLTGTQQNTSVVTNDPASFTQTKPISISVTPKNNKFVLDAQIIDLNYTIREITYDTSGGLMPTPIATTYKASRVEATIIVKQGDRELARASSFNMSEIEITFNESNIQDVIITLQLNYYDLVEISREEAWGNVISSGGGYTGILSYFVLNEKSTTRPNL